MTTNAERFARRPNHVPLSARLGRLVGAAALVTYGIYGVYCDDLLIRSRRGLIVHLHGAYTWMILLAAISAAVGLLTIVVDHYDTRRNEEIYQQVAGVCLVLGAIIAIITIIVARIHAML
jgi:hypothetical protein